MNRNVFIIILLTVYTEIFACSGFVFKNGENQYLCSSLDQFTLHGYIIQNNRNVLKTSFNPYVDKKLEWISKYGSVTFTNIGREMPTGGINEVGLAVAIMTNSKMDYPVQDNRYELNELQWIQYILDNYSTVQEVISSDSTVRVKCYFDNIHYLICDKSGNVLIVEYIEGKMKCYSGENVPIPVLENSFYEKSILAYKQEKEKYLLNSRFSKLAYLLENIDKLQTYKPQDMFPILENARQSITKWQIVYDIKNMQIYYRAYTNNYLAKPEYMQKITGIINIEIGKLDFSKETLASTIGITGKGLEFQPYKKVFDLQIFDNMIDTYRKRNIPNISDGIKKEYLKYIETID